MSKLLLTGDYPIIASPIIAQSFGIPAAVFLQKLHYCLQKDAKKIKFWFHTYADWVKTLGIYSVSTIKRIVAKLQDKGILIVQKQSAKKWDQTNSYSINYDKLNEIFNPQLIEKPVDKKIVIAKPMDKKIVIAKPVDKPQALVLEKTINTGTKTPINQVATQEQLQELSVHCKEFYKDLRQLKVDIAPTDPALIRWVKNHKMILRLVAALKESCVHKYHWHTIQELQLEQRLQNE